MSRIPIPGNKTNLDPSYKNIEVVCQNRNLQVLYTYVHLIILKTPSIQRKLNQSQQLKGNRDPNLGVLFLQLDSVSRSSFHRALPNITNYLKRSGWFELIGHHKTSLNTYPNLKQIFTGEAPSEDTYENRVWFDWNANKYITGYFEDLPNHEITFKYYRNQTDYDPFIAKEIMEGLPPKQFHNYNLCNGPHPVFEILYDQMIDFVTTFQGHRYMGLFVSTPSSHDTISAVSMVQSSLMKYLKRITRLKIREDAIIFLYGDHGVRFGDSRITFEGAREDSMPALWISLPQWFQKKYPKIVRALKLNKNRLTSHLDFHHTLKHIISLNGGQVPPPQSCSRCHSLFSIIPRDRSCKDAGISPRYCFCNAQRTVSAGVMAAQKRKVAEEIVAHMNALTEKYAPGKCRHIKFLSLIFAYQVSGGWLVLMHTTVPNREFEVTWLGNPKNRTMSVVNVLQRGLNPPCAKGPIGEFCDCILEN